MMQKETSHGPFPGNILVCFRVDWHKHENPVRIAAGKTWTADPNQDLEYKTLHASHFYSDFERVNRTIDTGSSSRADNSQYFELTYSSDANSNNTQPRWVIQQLETSSSFPVLKSFSITGIRKQNLSLPLEPSISVFFLWVDDWSLFEILWLHFQPGCALQFLTYHHIHITQDNVHKM